MVSAYTDAAPVVVLGLGYVGCVTASCLAHLGHRVIGVDRDAFKVDSVTAGQAPFYEPDLAPIIREAVSSGRLSASIHVREAIETAGMAMICVGTPSEKNGNLGLEQLRRAAAEIAQCLKVRARPLVVAIRSTVFPGTSNEIHREIFGGDPLVSMVSNPEFLREGTAVRDFMEPSLIVVGGNDSAAVEAVADLYAPLDQPPCLVSLRTAEMIKYACNAFHALKIAFANEIGAFCAPLDIPAGEVMETLCRDTRLNLSAAYLKPGFAFGGSCLPKDLRAMIFRAGRLDLALPLLGSVLPSNERHLERAIQALLALDAERLGIFGLAFKENTDDLRESPVVTMLEQLIGKGRDLRVFDPHIQLDQIYGSNQRFLLSAIPHIGKLLLPSIDALLSWASYLVLTQKPSAPFAAKIRARGLPVLDLVSPPGVPGAANV